MAPFDKGRFGSRRMPAAFEWLSRSPFKSRQAFSQARLTTALQAKARQRAMEMAKANLRKQLAAQAAAAARKRAQASIKLRPSVKYTPGGPKRPRSRRSFGH